MKYFRDDDPIKDLGDFTNGWTNDRELGDDEGKLVFTHVSHVVKYIFDTLHKPGVYQFSFEGKGYQLTISAYLKELIV